MVNKLWCETISADECVTDGEYNIMIEYIKHHSVTDFVIHETKGTCSDTGQAFRFTKISGVLSAFYGGADAGDDVRWYANSTDPYPFITMLGNDSVAIDVDASDEIIFREGGDQFFLFDQTGAKSLLYGGANSSEDMRIYANSTDAYPFIRLQGNEYISLDVPNDGEVSFNEGGAQFFLFDHSGDDSLQYGGASASDDLIIYANTVNTYPFITITGGAGVDIDVNSGDNVIFNEGGVQRFKFYQHSIDFNSDRAIYINDDETYVGHGAGDAITTGTHNTLVGHDSGLNVADGIFNAVFGSEAGFALVDGERNTLLGRRAGFALTSGDGNVAIGEQAQAANNVSNVVAVGKTAGGAANQSACVYLGYTAGQNNTTANTLYINNTNSAFPLIYGEFANDKVKFGNSDDDWFFQVEESGDDTLLYGGATASDDLLIYANSVNPQPVINMTGGGDLWLSVAPYAVVRFGVKTGHADQAIDGYLTMKDEAGNAVYVATLTPT